jgi:hypothetical protein
MNNDYIKKLEEVNSKLEQENAQLEKSIASHQDLKNNLTLALAACRQLIYDSLKEAPKRNDKADREFESYLKKIKSSSGRFQGDVSPFDIKCYELIEQFIKDIEKKDS